ncbi:MAG: VanZ family protein [Candidatus Cloacimonetes bacterium]|nr:VanZ family protein [Candidatus Cloacimonadota bacterium]
MKKKWSGDTTVTQLNFIFYVLLLIMTPFLLLQNYLQAAIGIASNLHLDLGFVSIPWTVIIAGFILICITIIIRKQLRWRHPLVLSIIFLLFLIGQQLTDYYFGHKFYELQHNWHYIAYSGFAVVSWRFWKARGKTSAQIIGYTLLFALCASTLDELAQMPLSGRIFDICDIAKDTYGVVIGNILVFFLLEGGHNLPRKLRLTHPRLKDYFTDPLTLLFYEYIFVFFFISLSSTLSGNEYFPVSVLLPLILFLVFWLCVHLLQFRLLRFIQLGILGLVVGGLLVSIIIHRNDNISYNRHGLTVYKGIPLPYLDIMIKENGTFRFVDKKHIFNKRDQRVILMKCTDILIVGSGSRGMGGRGFTEMEPVQFAYNPNIQSMTQIIIMKTPAACQLYNRLKKEGKNVTFILHNTC